MRRQAEKGLTTPAIALESQTMPAFAPTLLETDNSRRWLLICTMTSMSPALKNRFAFF